MTDASSIGGVIATLWFLGVAIALVAADAVLSPPHSERWKVYSIAIWWPVVAAVLWVMLACGVLGGLLRKLVWCVGKPIYDRGLMPSSVERFAIWLLRTLPRI